MIAVYSMYGAPAIKYWSVDLLLWGAVTNTPVHDTLYVPDVSCFQLTLSLEDQ